jgi:hypothetical protein
MSDRLVIAFLGAAALSFILGRRRAGFSIARAGVFAVPLPASPVVISSMMFR